MTQSEALNILKTGANVFLTGEPGAGKTYVINQYVQYLKSHEIEPAITASTGIAATHISGMTIHAFSGIGIRKQLTSYDLDHLTSNEYLVKRISKTKVLIIDEISMLSAGTLSMVDMVCKEIKRNDFPFGGIQIILVGDFFQLPPISKNEDKNEFAFTSVVWKDLSLITCYLTEQHRQADAPFLDMLSAIRKNTIDTDHHHLLQSRMCVFEDIPALTTKLFSHNTNVDLMNEEELARLQNDEMHEFPMISTGSDALCMALKRGCLSPEMLVLKKGAVVMCTKNNPRIGFANGTLGTVVRFDEYGKYPVIELANGERKLIEPMDWIIEENGKIKAKITQIPLRLAWAITIHKSQGMSMDSAVIDLSSAFEYGQGYVALSRVRSLQGLHLLGINDQALQVHPDVLKVDQDFKNSSEKAQELFSAIDPDALKQMHDQFILAAGGKLIVTKSPSKTKTPGGTGKLVELRKTHKNAYAKWTKEDDEKLTELFLENTKMKLLMEVFNRTKGSIHMRLVKLGLIEE